MKRKIVTIVLLLSMFSGGYVVAESVNGSFEGNPIIKLFSSGKELTVSDVPAINYKNRTMVPIYLLNQLGVTTKWNSDTQSVDITLPEKHVLIQSQLDEIAKSVYELFGSETDPTKSHQGSGFVIGNNILVTNFHVGGDSAYIQFQTNGQWNKTTETLFKNKEVDLLGIKVNGLKPLKYSNTLPNKGDICYDIGYPDGKLTITEGTVNYINTYNGKNYIIHNAETHEGSSGGILLNGDGKVIGINYAGQIVDGKYEDWAIPISYALEEINKLQN